MITHLENETNVNSAGESLIQIEMRRYRHPFAVCWIYIKNELNFKPKGVGANPPLASTGVTATFAEEAAKRRNRHYFVHNKVTQWHIPVCVTSPGNSGDDDYSFGLVAVPADRRYIPDEDIDKQILCLPPFVKVTETMCRNDAWKRCIIEREQILKNSWQPKHWPFVTPVIWPDPDWGVRCGIGSREQLLSPHPFDDEGPEFPQAVATENL